MSYIFLSNPLIAVGCSQCQKHNSFDLVVLEATTEVALEIGLSKPQSI
jgi:hypothetical protein